MRELSARLALRVFPVPPRSAFVSVAKAGAHAPRWCRGHGADLSAAGSPPARFLSSLERQHPSCRGGYGGSMSFWLPSRARWSLDPGVRREDDERALRQIGASAFFRFLRALPSFPPQKRGPRNRGGATPTGRTSAQRLSRPPRRSSDLLKGSILRAAEVMAVRCPFGCHPELGGPWIPAFAGKTMRGISARLGPPRFSDSSALSLCFPRKSGGPGTAGVRHPLAGPQRSSYSVRAALRIFSSKAASFVPRRLWRFDALLVAIQSSVVPGSRRSPGRRGVGKRGAQEPRWCRGHGADLSAVSFPPARCLSALERKYPPCRGGCGGSMSSWLPSRARWSLGPGVRWEDEG